MILFKFNNKEYKASFLEDESLFFKGSIDISWCSISSLKDLPWSKHHDWSIEKSFNCSHNNLSNLEGGPKKVGKIYRCNYNKINDLSFFPKYIGEDFLCNNNKLTNLKGILKHINGNCWLQNNNLFSFINSPEFVLKNFWCHNNFCKSLYGCPLNIGGEFRSDIFLDEDYRQFTITPNMNNFELKEIRE